MYRIELCNKNNKVVNKIDVDVNYNELVKVLKSLKKQLTLIRYIRIYSVVIGYEYYIETI